MLTEAEKRKRLAELFAAYQASPDPALAALEERWNFVPGVGDVNPPVVFIGEAPGATEDRLRKPFCGNSGQVLGELLDTVGFSRDDVWITNCVKYRTDERNRDPSKEERAASRPYLVKELAILGCRYLVTLGKQPLLSMMSSRHMGVPKRGEWASLRIGGQPHWLLPLYHPAVAVYQRSKLPLLKREFQKVLERP